MKQCEACASREGTLVRLLPDLVYWSCKRCRHCLLEIAGDGQEEFVRAQEGYFSHDSILMQTDVSALDQEVLEVRKRIAGKHIAPRASVLEVGPGSGHFAAWLLSSGRDVQLAEHSPVLADSLEEKLRVRVHKGDFAKLNLSDVQVDAFCSFHVIEHVVDPVAHLSVGLSLVRPGGIGLVATPNAGSWQHRWLPQLSPNFDYAHLRVFSIASLIHYCEQAGWEVVSVETPEFSSAWLRVVSRILRRLRRQDVTVTAGQYAQVVDRRFSAAYGLVTALTWPLRRIQMRLKQGNEAFLVLRKPDFTVP